MVIEHVIRLAKEHFLEISIHRHDHCMLIALSASSFVSKTAAFRVPIIHDKHEVLLMNSKYDEKSLSYLQPPDKPMNAR